MCTRTLSVAEMGRGDRRLRMLLLPAGGATLVQNIVVLQQAIAWGAIIGKLASVL